MKPTEEIAVRLVGGAQSAYVQELSYFFLNLLDEVVRTNGAVIRGREIADFERLSRLSREEALAIYYKYRPAIDKQTREVLKTALKKTDDALVGQFVRAMGSRRHMTNLATIIAAQTAQGMNEVLERQNIALAKDQATLWYDVTAEAIARHQAGEPTRAVMERGVTRLANSGLETIDYISGTKTTIDAALRRHIVSQANQARNRLLMQRMDEWEWDLVFVDAHFGARPSHAEWQGKVYSRSGRSTEYPSLVDATGYGTVTGLCGANCYHYMTPYVPGYSQLPDMDYSEQERITGMTSDEYYAATQKQRRYERLIRSQKREISYLQEVRADAVKQRIRLGELQDKLRQFTHDNHLRRDYERERAWAVSKQPIALGRTDFRNTRKAMSRVNSGSQTKDVVSKSDFMKCATFEDLQKAVEEKYGFYIDKALEENFFEYTRGLCAGLDDALTKFPQLKKIVGNIKMGSAIRQTSAQTNVWGTIYINSKMLKAVSNTPCSDGRHEAGHLVEAMLSQYDEAEFMSAKHSKRIITRALRNYNKKYTENTYSAEQLIYNTISTYPSSASLGYVGVYATKTVYSESLAESVRVAIETEQIDPDSFLSFIVESIFKEIR
nr:MAG TPA: minor capsid protein [Caudoviricetes sp.]